jgi:hypothetical protein
VGIEHVWGLTDPRLEVISLSVLPRKDEEDKEKSGSDYAAH